MFEEEDKKTAEEWKPTSERTDAIQYILAATECPKQVRILINFLVGISKGAPGFDTSHGEIASRISGTKTSFIDESPKQWVKRAHSELKKWQAKYQLNLIEYEPGGDKTKRRKSSYRLHILQIADEVIARAQNHPLWEKNKSQAIERAAIDMKPEYAPIPIMYHRSRGRSTNKELEYNIRSSISFMRKAHEILDKDKTAVLLESKVLEEFEEVLKELKKRLLHNDSFYEEWNKQP